MSNPRKFSEKIQIQMQKQEEETRIFNEMMQESQMVKHLHGSHSPVPQQRMLHHPGAGHSMGHPMVQHASRTHHLIPSFPPYPRGGSLPNVNQMVNQSAGIDLQSALDNLEMLQTDRDTSPRGNRHPSPTPQTGHRRHYSPNHKRPMEYDVSQMPSYLLQPPESSHLTKRAHSDSALHQSANPQMMHQGGTQQQQQLHATGFAPTRRSPVQTSKNLVDPHYGLWNDPSKMMTLQNRPKSCEVSPINNYGIDQTRHQHQQQHSHLLPPTSIHNAPGTSNLSSGSLPDLTNPSMNFQTMVSPLDPEDVQAYAQNNGSNAYQNTSSIRPSHSQASSASPQGIRRSSPLRGPEQSRSSSHKKSTEQQPAQVNGISYHMTDSLGNLIDYSNYHSNSIGQNFSSYRSNSSSPGVHAEQLSVGSVNSSPSSPGGTSSLSNTTYTQDPSFLDMQQSVQHKFEQITMDQNGTLQQMNADTYMNNLLNSFATNEFMHRPGQPNELGQIPDIIFTGADDPTGMRSVDYSFLSSANASGSSFYTNGPGGNDPFASQGLSQENIDLLEHVLKIDQYELGMLTDETLRNVIVDPETEEQFRLDNNAQ
ncbi:hypothetical protein RvY_09323 [Ramazzottius varieornatus]|uniref:Transducer of regulated CREB activity N-terminal domain-containing protein n=1 Tax=Ramazzottius varieornatus TaxID=947166 RepID=A0A1D1VDJ3_RAMVA|nr:hypothetical protein RvY_09323 [Ramazzottius varieornatus]